MRGGGDSWWCLVSNCRRECNRPDLGIRGYWSQRGRMVLVEGPEVPYGKCVLRFQSKVCAFVFGGCRFTPIAA